MSLCKIHPFYFCVSILLLIGYPAAMQRRAGIRGHVYSPTGIAMPGADLQLYQSNKLVATTKTDDDGYYEFSRLSGGEYKFVIAIFNVRDPNKLLDLDSGELKILDVQLKMQQGYDTSSSRKVYGDIKSQSGVPLQRAIVKLISPYDQSIIAKTVTDESGHYELSIMSYSADHFILLAYKSGYKVAVGTGALATDSKIDLSLSKTK